MNRQDPEHGHEAHDLVAREVDEARPEAFAHDEVERYRRLFELAPDAYLVSTLDGVVLEANPPAERMLDRPVEVLRGSSLVDLVDEDSRGAFAWELALLAEFGSRYGWVVKWRRGETTFPADCSALVVPAQAGRPPVVHWLVRDVTERTRGHLALRHTYEQMEQRLVERTAQLEWANSWKDELLRREQSARAEADAARSNLHFLAEASELLASSLDYAPTLDTVARLAVPALADWCIVDLLEDDGRLQQMAAAHADLAKVALVRDLRRRYPPADSHPIWRVLRSGLPEHAPEVTDADLSSRAVDREHLRLLRDVGIRSHVVVPLEARGQVLGAISLVFGDSGRRYGPSHVELAQELARRCALAIDNARLYREAQQSADRLAESLALLDTLFDTAPVGLAFVDHDLRFVRVNSSLATIDGVSVDDHLGRTVAEVVPELAPHIEPLYRHVLETGRAVAGVEIGGTTAAAPGERRDWIVSYYPVRDAGAETRGVGVVVLEVTERRRAERRLATQYAVNRVLAEVQSLKEAAPRILEAVCRSLQWSVGVLWSVDDDGQWLACVDVWTAPERAVGSFESVTRGETFRCGEGLPGRVWQTGAPEWLPDVTAEEGFRRAETAGREGLCAAFAVPIAVGADLLGVMEFLSDEIRRPDEDVLDMMAAVGSQVGQFIERKRAEEERGRLLEAERTARHTAEEAQERLAFLAEASAALAASFDYESTLDSVAKLATTYLADYCLVDVLDDQGGIQRLAAASRDAALAGLLEETRRYPPDPERLDHPITRAIVLNEPILIGPMDEARVRVIARDDRHAEILRRLAPHSSMFVPIPGRAGAFGAITLASVQPGFSYGPQDLALGEDLARRAALAIDNARLFDSEQRARRDAERAAERTAALQRVTSALSESLSPGEVADVILDQGVAASGASGAWLGVATEGGRSIEVLRTTGYPGWVQERFGRIETEAEGPVPDVVRSGRPAFFDSRADLESRYPQVREVLDSLGIGAAAVLPLRGERGSIGAVALTFAGPRQFDATERAFLRALAQQCGQALERTRLYERERQARAEAESAGARLRFLLDASTVLASSLDLVETLEGLGHVAVSSLADVCLIDVLEDGTSGRVIALHADPAKQHLVDRLRERGAEPSRGDPAVAVMRTGRPWHQPETTDELLRAMSGDDAQYRVARALGYRSSMCVPLIAHARVLGAITFISTRPDRAYGREEVALAEELASRAALAVENARLYRDRDYVARTLQDSLLPPQLPDIPGVDLAARYRPAGRGNEVGGDFYDAFAAGDGWALVIGDVRGKGADAAAVMGLVRHTVRAAAMFEPRPGRILEALNEAMRQHASEERFATVAFVRLEATATGVRLGIASGGHPLPIVLRADGSLETVGRPGMLLGLFPEPQLADVGADLRPGDALVLYTDGVIEERTRKGIFGEAGLAAVLAGCRGLSAPAIAGRIEAEVDALGDREPRDDIAILVARVVASDD